MWYLLKLPRLSKERHARGLARGSILSDFRRELSLAGAKAYSSCLLGRVARVGEEHRNAARRRAWVRREDERREEDSRAHWLANVD